MPSVMSSYRQKTSKGSFYVVTSTTDCSGVTFTSNAKPETVLFTASTTSELPADSDYPSSVAAPPAVGTLLRDLGSEFNVYTTGAASGSLTSPNAKLSTWRAMVPVTASMALNEGAPGINATVTYIKVWSASGRGVGVVRAG
jgi:hypothetical protein